MKLHPQNPTPGLDKMEQPTIKPVEVREVVDIIELLIDGLGRKETSYYFQAARDRLREIKRRL